MGPPSGGVPRLPHTAHSQTLTVPIRHISAVYPASAIAGGWGGGRREVAARFLGLLFFSNSRWGLPSVIRPQTTPHHPLFKCVQIVPHSRPRSSVAQPVEARGKQRGHSGAQHHLLIGQTQLLAPHATGSCCSSLEAGNKVNTGPQSQPASSLSRTADNLWEL